MKTPQFVIDIMEKPMDRRDFLKHVGVGSLMLLGGGIIVKSLGGFEALTGGETAKDNRESKVGVGYGASTYGSSVANR